MVQSIDRAMHIIHILTSDDDKNAWAISEIAEKTALPISTVHRLIGSLIKNGLVMQIPDTKLYKIGYTWMEIGLKLLENTDFRDVTRPIMEQLAQDVKETVYFNIPSGNYSIIMDRIDSPRSVRIIDSLGERIPLHIGAANKTILANMPEKQAEQIIHSLISSQKERDKFIKHLREVKRNGYAISYGEKTDGTASVAAPVIGFNHKVIGAINIEMLDYEITDEHLTFLTDKVKLAAQTISMKIGRTF
ncbi:IclR family transcriptional regulator [Bacillus sp. J33]|uniref:IclR family transcriptional regulator n=1 Tax=Bacillus sp. J33 TaxID=935836 RepID=UPI000478724E|nr:IclR family transcriptional regulator [Bacillus sp. J33]